MENTKTSSVKNRSREWRNSVIIAVVIALILVGAFLSLFRQISRISNTSRQLMENQAETLSGQISNLLNNYNKMCVILSVSPALVQCADFRDLNSDARLQDAYTLSKELLQLLNLYGESINTLGVYFPASDSVVTMSRQLSSEHKDLFFNDHPDLRPELLEQMFSGSYRGSLFYRDGDKNWLVKKLTTATGNIAYILSEYNLGKAVRQFTSSTDGIRILVGRGTQLLFDNSPTIEDLEFNAALQEAIGGTLTLDDTYITSCKSTDLDGVSVIAAVPGREIAGIHGQLILLIVITSVVVVGSLLVLLYQLRSRVFRPLEQLVSSRKRDSEDMKDALEAISRDFVTMEDHRDELLRERVYLVPLTMGRLVYRIVVAPEDSQNLNRAASCLSMASITNEDNFAAFSLALVEDTENVFSGQTLEGRGFSRLHFFLDNVLRDLLFEQYHGYVVPVGTTHYTVLVKCPSDAQEAVEQVREKLLDFYKEYFSVVLTATDVELGQGPQRFIDIAIKQARELSLRSFWGKDTAPADGDESEAGSFYATCNMIRRLIAGLNIENYESTWSRLDALLAGALPASGRDIKKTRYRMYSMTAVLITSIEEQLGGDRELIETHSFDARLYDASSKNDYCRELKSILGEVVEYKDAQEKNTFVTGRMEDVRRYLLEHYTENSISVAGVAEEFGISVSYLSRSFKEAIGVNLLEYIQRLRITQAKKLLKTETVQNVAREVGFWDTQALTRVFKKYEGMVPADYKRLLDQERNWT